MTDTNNRLPAGERVRYEDGLVLGYSTPPPSQVVEPKLDTSSLTNPPVERKRKPTGVPRPGGSFC